MSATLNILCCFKSNKKTIRDYRLHISVEITKILKFFKNTNLNNFYLLAFEIFCLWNDYNS